MLTHDGVTVNMVAMNEAEKLAHVELCSEDVAKATMIRDIAIRDLRADGVSLRKIAAAAGLSHTAIAKICERGEGNE